MVKVRVILILFFLGINYMVYSGTKKSISDTSGNLLFKIVRSRDIDEVIYSVNYKYDGTLNLSEPIKVYWLRKLNKGIIEPLTWVQSKYSYGIKYLELEKDTIEFYLAGYPDRKMSLRKTEKGYKVFFMSGSDEVELSKIFMQFNGGTFWVPKISHIELHGMYVHSNTKSLEIIEP